MRNILTGPNGLFVRLDTLTVRCGDFTRDFSLALCYGRLLNSHGEVLDLTTSQREWLRLKLEEYFAPAL